MNIPKLSMGPLRRFEIIRIDHLLIALLFLSFASLVARGQGVLPSIMADEWHYSLLSRLLPLSQSNDPGFIYLALYKLTNACGSGYLGCARVLNSLFYVGGCFLIYLTARLYLSAAVSFGVALLGILAPENVYTVFFMPESLYFLAFWGAAYVVLRATTLGRLTRAMVIVAGLIVGIASLVKPHALFLAAGMLIFLLLAPGPSVSAHWSRRLGFVAIFTVTVLTVKFAIGFIAVGIGGVTLFGLRYSNIVSQTMTADRALELAVNTGLVLINHITLLAFLFSVPLIGLISLLTARQKQDVEMTSKNFALFVLVILGTLLAVTAAFSASVAGTNPYDVIGRVHMRYYSFALPLVVIAAALIAHRTDAKKPRHMAWIASIVLPLCLLGAARVSGLINDLQINFVDSPSLMFLSLEKSTRWMLVLLSLSLTGLALFHFRTAARLHLWVFIPLVFSLDSYGVQHMIESRKHPDAYDAAGVSVASLLSGKRDVQITLFGPDEAMLYKTVFYLDRTNSAIRVVPSGTTIDAALVPAEATHLLIFGGRRLDKAGFKLVIDDEFKLYSRHKK